MDILSPIKKSDYTFDFRPDQKYRDIPYAFLADKIVPRMKTLKLAPGRLESLEVRSEPEGMPNV